MNIDNCFVIGHIGRFSPQKNHSFLLDIFNHIQRKIPYARLLLIGDGTEKTRILADIKKWGLEEKVLILNYRKDISNLLQAMDLFMLPSLYEGLPLSCLEAQAAGLPCIISDRISSEVVISPISKRISLDDKFLWVRNALNYCCSSNTNFRICPLGLPDIEIEAAKLLRIYQKI